jgi:hypothetical protein
MASRAITQRIFVTDTSFSSDDLSSLHGEADAFAMSGKVRYTPARSVALCFLDIETPMSAKNLTLFVLSTCFALAGCESKGSVPTDPIKGSKARQAAEAYLMAMQYSDEDAAFKVHIDSTDDGTWCGSEQFSKILSRMREGADEKECRRARILTDARPEELDDEAMMLLQTMRFVCENPEGTCKDYARVTFFSRCEQLEKTRGKLSNYIIQRESPDASGSEVTLYVDLDYGKPPVKRAAIHMKKVGSSWYVEDEPGEL